MRVLFTTWAAPGHLFPMVPLAWALQAAGHEVRVAGPPSCQESVVAAGLSGVRVGEDAALKEKGKRPELAAWGRPARWPSGWSANLDLLDEDQRRIVRALYEKQSAVAEVMLDDLVEFGRWWRPDLIVHDALSLAGPVLAAVLGVPCVGHGWEIGSTLHPPTGSSNTEPLPAYLELFARRGVEPVEPARWIDPCPAAMRPAGGPPLRRLATRCVPYNGASQHPDWLPKTTNRPRICLTAGVAGARYRDPDGPDVLRLTLDALAATDAEIVLAPSGPMAQDKLPDQVRVARGVPFQMLLSTCDAVVHHGGAGTAVTSVVRGVPQLVVPPSPICTEIGYGVERAGVGEMLDRLDSTELLAKRVTELLAARESYQRAAERVRADMATLPTPAGLVDQLLSLCRA